VAAVLALASVGYFVYVVIVSPPAAS